MAASKGKPSNDVRAPGQPPARTSKEKGGQTFFSDHVLKFSTELVNWVYAWRVPVLLTLVGIFVVAGGMTLWDNHKEKKNYEGAAQLYNAVSSLPDYDDSLARRGIDISGVERSDQELKERQDKYLTAANSLEKIAEEHSTVTSGTMALLERANLLEKAEKPDEAIATYKKVLEAGSKDPLFKYMALNGLGQLLRDNKKYSEAAQYFSQASNELDGVWKELGTIELAKTQELQEDYQAAIRTYEEFLKKFPNSGQADDVEKRLAFAKRMASPAPAGAVPAPEREPVGAESGATEGQDAGSGAEGENAAGGSGGAETGGSEMNEESAPKAPANPAPEGNEGSDSSSGEGDE